MNVYANKMAAVFIFSTSTILQRTEIVPRWIAFLGYVLGASLLLSVENIVWIHLVFPVWVFLVSLPFYLKTHQELRQLLRRQSNPGNLSQHPRPYTLWICHSQVNLGGKLNYATFHSASVLKDYPLLVVASFRCPNRP